MKNTPKVKKKSKLRLLHQYYSYTGFYTFIGKSLKKAMLPLAIIVVSLILFNKFIFNINDGLESLTELFSTLGVLGLFFASESLLGLIPPEIFIAWTKKTTEPILNLLFLATISYAGGIISYFLGKAILNLKKVRNYLENKMEKQLKNTSKWGGFLIVVGALLPVPFSITCLAGGMIKYPLKGVLFFGLLRFVRFAIYGAAIFQVVS